MSTKLDIDALFEELVDNEDDTDTHPRTGGSLSFWVHDDVKLKYARLKPKYKRAIKKLMLLSIDRASGETESAAG